jgi:tetratricopeptide (TPR) repeat protein
MLAVWRAFEEANDRDAMLMVGNWLSHFCRGIDRKEARLWSERTLELARANGSPVLVAGALSNLADVLKELRDFIQARDLYREAMRLFQESGDRENVAWCLSHQADLARQRGDDCEAGSLYGEALVHFRDVQLPFGIASCLYDLAGLAAATGDIQESERLYQESLQLYGAEDQPDLPRVLESLAGIALQRGRPERALSLAGAAAAIRERFCVRTLDSARRAEVEMMVDKAREQAGSPAAAHWMKGWAMNAEEAIAYALQD